MTNAVEKASFSSQSALPGELPTVAAAKKSHLTAFNCSCLPAEDGQKCWHCSDTEETVALERLYLFFEDCKYLSIIRNIFVFCLFGIILLKVPPYL